MDNFDCIVIGTGVAGLATAIKLGEQNLRVCVLTRTSDPNETNTSWAQGGIVYSDDAEFAGDIQRASSGTSDPAAVDLVARISKKTIEDLLLNKAKTEFDTDEDNSLLFTREAAHSASRIIYKGDYTGEAIQISLLNYLKHFTSVEIFTSHTAIDLITPGHHGKSLTQRYEEDKVVGVYAFDQKKEQVKKIIAKKVVLATGGIGALYLHNSNTKGSRGDGHAMAKRAGASLINMEFIQFHPTTFYGGSYSRRFLISEALRGEGAKLLNRSGERFMLNYHPEAELAPRDVVARAILSEMIRTNDDCVYLDIRDKETDWLQKRFPKIYEYCKNHNIDIASDLIPVVPAAHYTCGGIKTNINGESSLKNLYAVGEVAATGLHGANRLASTSLSEGLVFGTLAAEHILQTVEHEKFYDGDTLGDWVSGHQEVDLSLVTQDIQTIRQTMWNYLGLIRSKNRLKRAKAMFTELSEEIQEFYRHAHLTDELIGLRNAIEVAYLVLNSSMINKTSVGCFFRED